MDEDAFIPVRYTASADELDRWRLTLEALGIPYLIIDLEETDGWSIRVPPPFAETARDALRKAEADARAEQAEELREQAREEIARREQPFLRLSALPGAVFVAGLGLFTFLAGLGDASTPSRWFEVGANVFARTRGQEPWRAVTALTLHANVEHLVANAAAAMFMLPLACEFWGLGVGVAFTVFAGALGNAVEAWLGGAGISLGASTALFAALGVCGGTRMFREGTSRRDAFLIITALLVMFGMFGLGRGAPDPLEVLFPGTPHRDTVDVLAHLLGFAIGGLVGASGRKLLRQRPSSKAQWAAGVLTVLLLLGSWELALRLGA